MDTSPVPLSGRASVRTVYLLAGAPSCAVADVAMTITTADTGNTIERLTNMAHIIACLHRGLHGFAASDLATSLAHAGEWRFIDAAWIRQHFDDETCRLEAFPGRH